MARKLKQEPTKVTSGDHPMRGGSRIMADSDTTIGIEEDRPQDAQHGTTNGESLNNIGRGVKELVQAVNVLRQLGVEELGLPLPKIVVVGDQSTGKSSLIEGISEIKVPRSAGTCTRCPLEINLTEDNEHAWSCKLRIHKKYMYTGSLGSNRPLNSKTAKAEGATRARPLGPWSGQQSEYFDLGTIHSHSEVEDALYLAQLAVLNPSKPYEDYKYVRGQPKPPKDHQVKFSPNVIQLNISGPGLPNLSFYDLPGVINVSEVSEEAYLVDLVKNLVKQYITQDDCINLLAIAMTDDPANSSASKLVRETNAEGRTLGCLTKPDRLQEEESIQQWVEILDGYRYAVGHGYHVIKNNANPAVDHSTARQEEKMFFEQEEPWCTDLRSHHERFGTASLQNALARLLTQQIQKSLPHILEKVQEKSDEIEAALKKLPEPVSDTFLVPRIMGELLKLKQELQLQIEGGETNHFQKKFDQIVRQFRNTLADTKPIALLAPETVQSSNKAVRDSSIESMAGTPTPARRVQPTINLEEVDDDQQSVVMTDEPIFQTPIVNRKRGSESNHYEGPSKTPRTADRLPLCNVSSTKFTLEEVRNVFKDTYIGLPGETHPKATEKMISMSMKHWQTPVNCFRDEVKSLCQNMVLDAVHKVFGHRQHTNFFVTILDLCEEFLNSVIDEHHKLSQRALQWELALPKTLDEEVFQLRIAKARKMILENRRHLVAKAYLIGMERKGRTTGSTRDGGPKDPSKVSDDKLPPETYVAELQAIAVMKGYYECAYSRFTDVLHSSSHLELFGAIRNKLVDSLSQKLIMQEDASERLPILLAADPIYEEQRLKLKKQKETIDKALEHLESLA